MGRHEEAGCLDIHVLIITNPHVNNGTPVTDWGRGRLPPPENVIMSPTAP